MRYALLSRKYLYFFLLIDPTKILIPPQDIKINRGSMAELLCKAQYDQSELKILWQKDGKEIDSNYTEYSRWAA